MKKIIYTAENIVGKKFTTDANTYVVVEIKGDSLFIRNINSQEKAPPIRLDLRGALCSFNDRSWLVIEPRPNKPKINDTYKIF